VVRIAEVSATAAVQDEGEGSVTQQGTVSCWYLHTRNCVVCSALLSLSPRASESISCPIALTLSHSVSHHHLLLPSDTRGVQRMTSTQSRKSSLSSSRRVLQTVARSLMDSLPLTRFPFPSHCPHSLVVQSHTSRSHSTLLPTASMLTQSSTRSRHPESECAAVLTLHRMLLACNVCVCVCVCVSAHPHTHSPHHITPHMYMLSGTSGHSMPPSWSEPSQSRLWVLSMATKMVRVVHTVVLNSGHHCDVV
jgi:hypothetical protein